MTVLLACPQPTGRAFRSRPQIRPNLPDSPTRLRTTRYRHIVHDQIIKWALGGSVLDDPDSSTVSEVTVQALERLLSQLAPVVGELASRALYSRSLHLARSSFAKPVGATDESRVELFAPLRIELASRSAQEALAAAESLLFAFSDLLVSMIGEVLTYRLLRKAWTDPVGDAGQGSMEKTR
jgi:hypothetical protein